MPNSTIELLMHMAERLEPLLGEVVFVGGSVTALLIDDQPADVRATKDVDVVVATPSYSDYTRFSERLRELGFTEDRSVGAPICRWTIAGMILDVMPYDERILGFSNRWYKAAIEKAQERRLPNGLNIRVITAPYFVATKLEAFRGRGKGDYAVSPDLEDMIAVIDGRPQIVAEVAKEHEDLRNFLSTEFSELLKAEKFKDVLAGYLPSDEANQARLPGLIGKIEQLAKLLPKA